MSLHINRRCLPPTSAPSTEAITEAMLAQHRNEIQSILLYGPKGAGKSYLARHIALEVMRADYVVVVNSVNMSCTPLTPTSISSKVVGLESIAASATTQSAKFNCMFKWLKENYNDKNLIVVLFEECELLFAPTEQETESYISKLLVYELKRLPVPVVALFCTSRPSILSEELLDIIEYSLFVPLPSKDERSDFIAKCLKSRVTREARPIGADSTCTSSNQSSTELELADLLSLKAQSASFERLSRFADIIVGKHAPLRVLQPHEIEDLANRFFFKRAPKVVNVEQNREMVMFAQRHGVAVTAEELGYPNNLAVMFKRFHSKRKMENGEWEVKVKQWYFTYIKAKDSMEIQRMLPFLQEDSLPHSVFAELEANSIEPEPVQVPVTTVATQTEKPMQIDSGDYHFKSIFDKKKSKSLPPVPKATSSAHKPSARKFSQVTEDEPDSDLEESQANGKRLKREPGSSKNWYRSFEGALAYAVLKAKVWSCRNDGYMDVRMDAGRKFGGAVYDWDILWLGMKLIPNELKQQKNGINHARRFVKSHPIIAPYLAEWRKRRPIEDEMLKKIFKVHHINSDAEMLKYMNEHKVWSQEEEEKFLAERRAKAKEIKSEQTTSSSEEEDSTDEDDDDDDN